MKDQAIIKAIVRPPSRRGRSSLVHRHVSVEPVNVVRLIHPKQKVNIILEEQLFDGFAVCNGKDRKEVNDLTIGGLYFTAERSAADRNTLTPSLQPWQEQYREFHKKRDSFLLL